MEIKSFIVGPLLTNCYLISSGDESAVIDPGGGLNLILKELKNKKLNYIILTHYHLDHTLAVEKLKEETGGAKILISQEEKEFMFHHPEYLSTDSQTPLKSGRLIKFKADHFLVEGEEIKIGNEVLKVILTPGHSPGSICLAGRDFIFTGDTLFKDGVGRTDLPGGSERDLKNSLKKLEKIIKPGMKIYPGHGPIFEKF